MLPNPAFALARLAEEWQVLQGGNSLLNLRGLTNEAARGDLMSWRGFWERHAEAVELITEVRRRVDARGLAGHRVQQYDATISAFYSWIFAVAAPQEWDTAVTHPQEQIEQHHIFLMDTLADVFEAEGSSSLTFQGSEAWREAMEAALEEVDGLLMDAPSPIQDRLPYVRTLLLELQNALFDTTGPSAARARRISQELSGVLLGEGLRVAVAANPADRPWLKRLGDSVARVAWLGVGAAVNESSASIATLLRSAIEQ